VSTSIIAKHPKRHCRVSIKQGKSPKKSRCL